MRQLARWGGGVGQDWQLWLGWGQQLAVGAQRERAGSREVTWNVYLGPFLVTFWRCRRHA